MGENANHGVKFVTHFSLTNSSVVNATALIDVDSTPRIFPHAGYFQVTGRCFDGYRLYPVRIQSHATSQLFFLKVQPHVADHHQISDETHAARIQSTCLTQTVPHKICAAARTKVPLFTESKSTRNPTTFVSNPSHNPHKHYCQIKKGNVKCCTLYILQCGLGYVLLPLNWHGCPTTPLPTSVTRMRALLYTLATNGPAGSFWPATDTSTK